MAPTAELERRADAIAAEEATATARAEPTAPVSPVPVEDDLTGRDRLAWNVVASWAGHIVFVIAGFIMPRQIDRHVGQVGLGVWDFGWTAVNYFHLAQIGVGVSANRYVARYRAERDANGLSRMISSALLLQVAAATVVMILTAASALWLPQLFSDRLVGEASVATWVIALLGTSLAVRTATQAFGGVVTGCHRWDLHNLLNSVAYGVTVLAMLVALMNGAGLIGISLVYLIGTILNEAGRVVLAFRVCPELRVSPSHAEWSESRKLISFGAKVSSTDAVGIIVAQLTNMLVLSQIGIGTLAVFSRLGALIRHTQNIAAKYSLPLTPTASSLQGTGRVHDIRELVIGSTRIAAYLVFPILIGFAIIGDDVLKVWMGPQYDPTYVLPVMAAGSMFPTSQQPIFMILVGLNLHGRLAVLHIIGSVVTFAASLIALRWFHWDLLGLAAVTFAFSNITTFCVAVDTCRRLSIPVREYFVRAYAGPLGCAAPFAVGLVAIRLGLDVEPLAALVLSALLGAGLLGPLYWRVIPAEMRLKCMRRASAKLEALRLALQPES
jgi:O-antigen/teichoic acid export membrane protein